VLRESSRLADAEASFRSGLSARLSMHDEARTSPHEQFRLANAYHNLGDVLLARESFPEAEKACQKSIDLRKQLPESLRGMPENRHILALDRLILGTAANAAGRSTDATDHLNGALELAKSLIADFPMDVKYQSTLSKIISQLTRAASTSHDTENEPGPYQNPPQARSSQA